MNKMTEMTSEQGKSLAEEVAELDFEIDDMNVEKSRYGQDILVDIIGSSPGKHQDRIFRCTISADGRVAYDA